MNQDKWAKIIGNIKDNFKLEDEGEQHIDDEGGVDIKYIVFNGPLGKIRLEYIIKPVILDKKTTYSRRIGSETKVDYVYSEEDKSHQMIAYKWDEEQDDWAEMDASAFE
ncbi:hypothetical protein KAJ89_01975 [Candidatus Parcubacteria bacterium]|nr:hypothetical protein [Candidatus Parcubacteria bacterium]